MRADHVSDEMVAAGLDPQEWPVDPRTRAQFTNIVGGGTVRPYPTPPKSPEPVDHDAEAARIGRVVQESLDGQELRTLRFCPDGHSAITKWGNCVRCGAAVG